MKHVRFILPAVAALTVAATAAVALPGNTAWAVAVAATGVLLTVLVLGYIQLKTLQTVTQRLAGLQKQGERVAATLQQLQNRTPEETQVKLPQEVWRALEDLTLASRSLTVPQAHFDQLLRTISANTVRTEAALNDAVEEFRVHGHEQISQDDHKFTATQDGQSSASP